MIPITPKRRRMAMGLFDDLIDLTVNVVKTPVNIVTDVTGITEGETKKGLSEAVDAATDIPGDVLDGDL